MPTPVPPGTDGVELGVPTPKLVPVPVAVPVFVPVPVPIFDPVPRPLSGEKVVPVPVFVVPVPDAAPEVSKPVLLTGLVRLSVGGTGEVFAGPRIGAPVVGDVGVVMGALAPV